MSQEEPIANEPVALSNFSLMWNIRRNRRYLNEFDEKIKNLQVERKEVEEELKANEEMLINKYNDGKPHYLKFEANLIVAVYPNRVKLIELE